jgi:hypothetical protein
MLTTTKLAIPALIVSSLFGFQSQAKELSLQQYASVMIAQTTQTAINEIKLAVQTDILNAAYSFELVPSNIKTKVTITDIASTSTDSADTANDDAKLEKSE